VARRRHTERQGEQVVVVALGRVDVELHGAGVAVQGPGALELRPAGDPIGAAVGAAELQPA
jgi:hypothetical protein